MRKIITLFHILMLICLANLVLTPIDDRQTLITIIKPHRITTAQPHLGTDLEVFSDKTTLDTPPATNSIKGVKSWMIESGIPEHDWQYVDCVINGCQGVSAEGGWSGTLKWNTTGSGAYGLCQALPAHKMASAGDDYLTNPITQLRWCHQYAQGYGGWEQAWTFRKCVGDCYSPRTKTIVYKDHTWW